MSRRQVILDRLNAASDPARLRILDELRLHGDATATEIGRLVPEARTTIAYHLEVLADAGHIVAASGEGRGTVWRADVQPMIVPNEDVDDPEMVAACTRMEDALLRRRTRAQKDWMLARYDYPLWRDVASRDSLVWITPEQARYVEKAYADAVEDVKREQHQTGSVPVLCALTISPMVPS